MREDAVLVGALLPACGGGPASQETPPGSGYRVSGAITLAGAPAQGTVVDIDGSGIWTATTDSLGHFAIDDVPGGAHTLAASQSNVDGSFSERQASLDV